MDVWLETRPFRIFLFFASVAGSFVYVVSKIPRDCFLQRNLLGFFVLAVFSLYATCSNLISFILEDSQLYPDVQTWLKSSEPDVKALRATTESSPEYWWSSQLFCFLLPFISFINIKSRFIGMSTLELCAYVWLGLGGAVNMSLLLFLLRYNSVTQDKTKTVSPWRLPTWGIDVLGICLWVSFWCIVSLPLSRGPEVKHYLSVTHFVLFLPGLVPANPIKSHEDHTLLFPVFCGILVLITGQHWYQSLKVISELNPPNLSSLLLAGFANGIRSSISLDLLFCFLGSSLYILSESKFKLSGVPVLVLFILLTPILSLGSTFCLLMIYEGYMLHKQPSATNKVD